ncbi:MAG: hypothetical protein FJX80_09845 [Bacteroidetes bacterium]|jgi:aquaporin Z|nr:hypothetical protein [Bacteroidota bacterium]
MNKYLLEFLGTLFLVYIILATGNAVAIGAAYAIVIMVSGMISGGFSNPAVCVAMVATGKLPSSELLPYILSQIGGALFAFELFKRVKLSD